MEKVRENLPTDIECFSTKTLKAKLRDRYGDGLVITDLSGKPSVVCFLGTAKRVLTEMWYSERIKDPLAERQRIVETAAANIREDITSRAYNTETYFSNSEV